jgi:hypothetical protein
MYDIGTVGGDRWFVVCMGRLLDCYIIPLLLIITIIIIITITIIIIIIIIIIITIIIIIGIIIIITIISIIIITIILLLISIIIFIIIIISIIILFVFLGYILPSIQYEAKIGVGEVDIGKDCRRTNSYIVNTATIN